MNKTAMVNTYNSGNAMVGKHVKRSRYIMIEVKTIPILHVMYRIQMYLLGQSFSWQLDYASSDLENVFTGTLV